MKKMTGKNTLMLFLTAFIWGTAFVAQSVGMGLYRALYIYLCTLFDRWDFSSFLSDFFCLSAPSFFARHLSRKQIHGIRKIPPIKERTQW